jgi:hypothetical protein
VFDTFILLSSSKGRTAPFHGVNKGSIPLESTIARERIAQW